LYGLILTSLKRPVSIIMLYIGVMVIGILSGLNIPQEYVPDIAVPKLVVSTVFPSASPDDVRLLVTIPLEDSLSSLNGLKTIKSVSRSGISAIELEFQWGADILLAGVKTREIIDRTFPVLPEGCKKPLVFKIDPNQKPLIIIGVYPERGNLLDLRRTAERELKTEIQQVNGVGSVVVAGGSKEEVHIDVNNDLLSSRKINITDLASYIAAGNINFPAGSFNDGSKEYVLKVNGEAGSIDGLKRLKLFAGKTGKIITTGNIGTVYMGEREQRSFFQSQGDEGIGLIVRRRPGKNPVEVSGRIKEKIKELNMNYGKDLNLNLLYDASESIKKSINGLFLNLVLGGIIAFAVILIFIRNLKSSFILVASMPFSIFFTLILMKLTGLSFNIMSLGGLALGIGMLVDNSVVVLENIDKRTRGAGTKDSSGGIEDIAAYTNEMAGSTFGSTITSIIVFLPVLFLPGIIGALYRELALTVSFSLAASFFVSITLIPVLYNLAAKQETTAARRLTACPSTVHTPAAIKTERLPEVFYRKLLVPVLKRRYIIIAAVCLLAIGSIYLLKIIRFRFMPPSPASRLVVDVVPEAGTNMQRIKDISESVTGRLLTYTEIKSVYCRAGAEPDDTYFISNPEESRETIHLFLNVPDSRTLKRLKNRLEKNLRVQDAEVRVHTPDDIILKLLKITGSGEKFVLEINNLSDAAYYRRKLTNEITRSGYFERVYVKPHGKIPEIYLEPDRAEISRTGISVRRLAGIIRASVYGQYPTRITLGGEKYDVRLRLPEHERNSIENLNRIVFTDDRGSSITVGRLVKISEVDTDSSLMRINRNDAVYLTALEKTYYKKQADDLLKLMQRKYPQMKSVSGSVFADYLPSIILTFAVALLLLYLFLGAQFESFIEPLILLITLPLSLMGVIPMLILGGSSLNLNSVLGILVLFGISVNNSIVLKDTIKHRTDKTGRPDINSITESSVERLRPILITTTTTIAALIPTAFNIFGQSPQSSLALAVIGGLFVSTLLTLFVIPAVSVKKNHAPSNIQVKENGK